MLFSYIKKGAIAIAKGLVIKVDGDTKPLEKSLGKIGSVAQKGLGVTVKGIAAISTGFAAATGAALKFRGELEQNLGGSKAVFKEFADDIQENAERAFSKAGLSASNYLATANKMGALFQGAGFSIKESADLTTQAMQRAADVASIMGIDTTWAMESIAGAAKGNFTMMDNLGVAMNETTLNAYALEKGIGKTTAKMTNQEKIGLAMKLFLERTAYAAGNYAKENETLAGSLGTAKASLENFVAGAGNVDDVVDSVLNAGKVIAKNIKEILPELGQGLSDGLRQILAEVPEFIDDNADEFAQGAADLVMVLVGAIIDGTPAVVSAAAKLLVAFTDKLGEAVPILKPITGVIGLIGDALTQTSNRVINLLDKNEKAYQELKSTKDEAIKSELVEVAKAEALCDQLQSLADASGEVEEKDRGRVQFILKELNEALGTEYKMVDGVIQKYGELSEAVENLAAQKRAEILLQNNEEAYNTAITNKDAAVEAQAEAYYNLKRAVEEANAAYDGLNITVEEMLENGISEDQMYAMANNGLHDLMNTLQRSANAYNEASEDVARYSSDISKYTEAMAAAQEGNYAKVIAILDEFGGAYKTSTEIMEEQSEKTLGEVGENYAKAVSGAEAAYNNLLKCNNSVNREALQKALSYAATMRVAYENAGGEVVDGYVTGMDGKKILLTDKTKEIMLAAAKAYGEDVSEFEANGTYSVDGIIAGATSEENKTKLYNAYFSLGQLSVTAYNAGQDAHSPAKEFVKASKNSIDGLIKGIDDNADRLIDRMEDLSDEALEAEISGDDALLEAERTYLSESRRMEREKEEKEYREKLANAKTAEAAQKIKNERLQKLQEEADERYLDQLRETAETERKLVEERKNNIIDTLQDAADAAMDAVEDLADRQERFRDKLLGDVKLFKKVTFKGVGEDGTDLQFTDLADLDKQSQALEEYADLLLKVRDRGELPNGFFDELREMSIEEGTAFAKTLLDADDDTFARYIQSWDDIQNTGDRLAKEVFGEDAEELKRSFEEEFGQLPEDFFELGEDSIQQFGDGFMNKLQEVMQNIKREIQASLSSLAPAPPFAGAISGGFGGPGSVTNTITYNLSSAGESIHQQLQAINAAETVKQLRG